MEHAKARPFVRFARWLVSLSAYAYPFTLLALAITLRTIGERHWITAGLLYVPPISFLAPLGLIAPASWLLGRRDLLWTQVAALFIVLFPLMGLVLPWPASSPRTPRLRLLSFNVDSSRAGADVLLSHVDSVQPDLVLFQESPWSGPLHDGLRARFPHVDASTQFLLASRFPIVERTEPHKLHHDAQLRSPRFMRYVLDSSLGKIAVYNLHPISPRGSLGVYRFRGALHGLKSGAIWDADPEVDLGRNAQLREAQVAAVQSSARAEPYPVVLAGDTNLPSSSAALRRHLAGYIDGFTAASWGFGYTFPANRPFFRLDRVLASPALGFAHFRVGCPGASDHLCLVTELFRR